jgi:hypothetical protein
MLLSCYWVLPGRLLAGEYPGAGEPRLSQARLRWLLSQGVTWVLDLTQAGEYGLPPYADWLQAAAAADGRRVAWQRQPVRDYDTPSLDEMEHIQQALQSALADGHTIYVHCYGGVGRTGTVVGCFLRRQGFDGPAALAEIARLRQGLIGGERPSPETEAQRRMILEWKAGSK